MRKFGGNTIIAGIVMVSALFMASVVIAGPLVTEIRPTSAQPGETVELVGSGFDTLETYLVRVDGVPGSVTGTLADRLSFVVPAGARSGLVEIEAQGTSEIVTTRRPLTVLRSIGVQIGATELPFTGGYVLGTAYDDVGAGALVPVGEPGYVAAGGPNDDDPALIGVATENTNSLTLDASGTATALVFLTPFASTADPVEAETRVAVIAGLPETQVLAALVAASLQSGTDYLEDPGFDDAFVTAIEAYLLTLPESGSARGGAAGSSSGRGGTGTVFSDDSVIEVGAFATGSPRSLPHDQSLPDRHTDTIGSPGMLIGENGVPLRTISFRSLSAGGYLHNPLDWVAGLYELDPWQSGSGGGLRFARGNRDVLDLLNTNETFGRQTAASLGFTIIPQETVADHFNLFNLLRDAVLGDRAATPAPSLTLAADRPGVYLTRQFSGAVWPDQAGLVTALPDGLVQHASAFAINLLMICLDYASAVLPVEEVIGEGTTREIVFGVANAARDSAIRAAGQGGFDVSVGVTLVKDTGAALVGGLIKGAAENALKQGPLTLLKSLGKVALKTINVFDKVGSLGKAELRTSALFNMKGGLARALVVGLDKESAAVESTAVVIGDPWRPVISGFSPASGHRGTKVRIEGRNFWSDPALNVVEFETIQSGPDDPAPAPPNVPISATDTSLVVEVPVNVSDGPVPIGVRVLGLGGTTTAALGGSMQAFEVLPDPLITAVDPVAPVFGQTFRVIGTGFAAYNEHNRLYLPGSGSWLAVIASSPTELIVQGFTVAGLQEIQAQILDTAGTPVASSNLWPVDVVLPPGVTAPPGVMISVTSTADNLTADDTITLREAMRWATEGLSFRAPSVDEQSLISGALPPIATDNSDVINFPGFSSGTVITLNPALGPLPSVGDHDQLFAYTHGVIVDGAGMTADGLLLGGTQDAWVEGLDWRNFDGHCVRLIDASLSEFRDVVASGCTLDGIRLEGNSKANELINIGSESNLGDGVRLDGAGVEFNELTFDFTISSRSAREIADNGGYGVAVAGGARANRIHPGDVLRNTSGGIHVLDGSSTENTLGFGERVASLEAFMLVADNLGHGVRSAAGRTTVRYLEITGNQGDGILLDGSQDGSKVRSCRIGIDGAGTAQGNSGSGVHLAGQAANALIGDRYLDAFNLGPPNQIGGNGVHGVWLDGTGIHGTTVNNSRIGASLLPPFALPNVAANGLHGVALTGGAHDNTIGDPNEALHLEVVGHTAGAGIFISGSSTRDNVVIGNQIGNVFRLGGWPADWRVDASLGNRYGVQITAGAWGNRIGKRGWWAAVPHGGGEIELDSGNYFYSNSEAGLLIESGGDPSQTIPPSGNFTPVGGNIVENNLFGNSSAGAGNGVGLILRGAARANRIGGTNDAEENVFRANVKAGLHVDGVTIATPSLANRIVRNWFRDTSGPVFPPDPLEQIADGVGILVTGSHGQPIGGDLESESNWIYRNRIGVHVDQSTSIEIRNNSIGLPLVSGGNHVAGVILSDSQDCVIGPNNEFQSNGRPDPGNAHGAISILRGSNHVVEGNVIGANRSGSYNWGNQPWGVLLRDTSGNRIGGRGAERANTIIQTVGDGVVLESGSLGNQVANNFIGVDPKKRVHRPNLGAGVLLRSGATGNTIGGTLSLLLGATAIEAPVGNVIRANTDAGIVTDGAGSVGNSFTHNSITEHPGQGIDNRTGGNQELPPPAITDVADYLVQGTVDPSVAAGSRVQVFSDLADEGEVLIAEALTDPAGNFRAPLHSRLGTEIHAVVTDAASGSSSEFGSTYSLPAVLSVALDPAVSPPAVAPNGAAGVVVLPIVVQATELSGEVAQITLQAAGTVYDPQGIAGISIYDDHDGDGLVSAADPLLGGPATFDTDDGTVVVPLSGAVLSLGETVSWLIAVDLAANATVGTTFSCEITAALDVDGRLAFVGSPIPVLGSFPISAGGLTVTPAASLGLRKGLRVSSDPADGPNFLDIQSAIDVAGQTNTRIVILPGLTGIYQENLVIGPGTSVILDGAGLVILDGGVGSAVTAQSGSGGTTLRNLTLTGQTGMTAFAATAVREVVFDVDLLGLDLRSAGHEVVDSSFGPGTAAGIVVESPAELWLDRSELLGLAGTGLELRGAARVTSSLFAGGATAILVDPAGSLELRNSTLADGTTGVESVGGGSVSIASSISWNHASGDLAGVACTDVTTSLTGTPDCSSAGGNLSVDPQFAVPGTDYRPTVTSPVLDAGPDLLAYDGTPCRDLDDSPRLRDHDADGVAHADLGAYERLPAPTSPGEVPLLEFVDGATVVWGAEPGATEYHVYRGSLADLGYADFGSCRDDLDPDRTDTILDDSSAPTVAGEGWFYVITADALTESTAGIGTCAERSRAADCP